MQHKYVTKNLWEYQISRDSIYIVSPINSNLQVLRHAFILLKCSEPKNAN